MKATIKLGRDLKCRLRESKLLRKAYAMATRLRREARERNEPMDDTQIRQRIMEELKPISLAEAKRLEKGRAFDDESYSMKKLIRWVFNNLEVKNIEPSDAPSSGAFAMWKWATSDPKNRSEFYTTHLPKLIPARGADTDEDKPGGGIAHVVQFIDKILKNPVAESK